MTFRSHTFLHKTVHNIVDDNSNTFFLRSCIDVHDVREHKMLLAYNSIIARLHSLSGPRQVSEYINDIVSKDVNSLVLGLIAGVLKDKDKFGQYYFILINIPGNGVSIFISELNNLIIEKHEAFHDCYKRRLVEVMKELVEKNMAGAEILCWNLLRCIKGGHVTCDNNRYLTCQLMAMLSRHVDWHYRHPELVRGVVVTYTRLLEDYVSVKYKDIRADIASFVVKVIRDMFGEVMKVGRDLVRLLVSVGNVPEVSQLWQDILHHPGTLHHEFTGVEQLLRMKTPRQFLALRVTPDMETKLRYLVTEVSWGRQGRYMEWMARQQLLDPGTWSVKTDMIRFLVTCIHPTNDQLQSGMTPRWVVIDWLLQFLNTPDAANAKMALILDLLFFDVSKDSIMDIEPVLLLLKYSVTRDREQTTAKTLLDFLAGMVTNFFPPCSDLMRTCVTEALVFAKERGVIPNVSQLLWSPSYPDTLRSVMSDTFEQLYIQDTPPQRKSRKMERPMKALPEIFDIVNNFNNNDNSTPSFSDDEENNKEELEKLTSTVSRLEKELNGCLESTPHDDSGDGDVKTGEVKTFYRKLIEKLKDNKRNLSGVIGNVCDSLDYLNLNKEECRELAEVVVNRLESLDIRLLGSVEPSFKCLQDIFHREPLFKLFSNLDNISRRPLMRLLAFIHRSYPLTGAALLLYSVVMLNDNQVKEVVKEFHKELETKERIPDIMASQLTELELDHIPTLVFLIVELSKVVPELIQNHGSIIHLLVSNLDGSLLQFVVCKVVSKEVTLLTDECQTLLHESLTWETMEQWAFWTVVQAHHLNTSTLLSFLPSDMSQYEEASTYLQVILSSEGPQYTSVDCLLGRTLEDSFSVAMFRRWMKVAEERLTAILGTMLHESRTVNENKVTINILSLFSKLGLHYQDSTRPTRQLLDKIADTASSDLRRAHPQLFSENDNRGENTRAQLSLSLETNTEPGRHTAKKYSMKIYKAYTSSNLKVNSVKRKREAWIV